MLSVRRPCGGDVGSAGAREVDHATEDERVHANLEAVFAKGGEGDAGVVRRDSRGKRDWSEMGDGVLVCAVVVHLPDLFVGSGDLDVVDLGFGDALDAAAEAEDDLVGEAVGDLAG